MNLQGIAVGYIAAVNPQVSAILKISLGASQDANFVSTPSYRTVTGISAQVQAMGYKDIVQTEGLNLNGTRRAIYLNGEIDGLIRTENKGGDLVLLPTAQFEGSIAETTLTIDATSIGTVKIGDAVMGAGVADGTTITAFLSGTGGPGTYTVSQSQTVDDEALTSYQTWLVAMVLEQWPDWCKVACTLQNGT